MISRRTSVVLAEIYFERFTYYERNKSYPHLSTHYVYSDKLYDWLFEQNYPAWFCNGMQKLSRGRALKEFVMKLHTGEALYDVTKEWTWKQRERLGQNYLRELAEDILGAYENDPEIRQAIAGTYGNHELREAFRKLRSSLELDGYVYRNGHLLAPESDVLDVQEEAGVLESLYASLQLTNLDMFRYHLKLSEEHYLAGRWGDSISNSRNVLESVLREVAAAHSLCRKQTQLPDQTYKSAVDVRKYLEQSGLLEAKEREVIQYTYGLLSNTGSHPYMAEKDQARLLRHMALTLSQFVLLRLQGALN
jgi:hypothetical protein